MAREIPKARAVRKPLHQRGPLSISGEKDPNYVYRFVNDIGSRVQNFTEAGYEFVNDDALTVGDARVSDASSIGSNKRVTSDNGIQSYLMRIKKEWYVEDQQSKAELITEQEKAMKQEASQGMYGKLNVTRD